MSIKEDAILIGGIGLGVVLIAWYLKRQAGAAVSAVSDTVQAGAEAAWDGAKAAATAVNPVNNDNIINRGVSAVGATVTGKDDWSLGTAIYDLLH